MYCITLNVINFGLISEIFLLLSSKITFQDFNYQNSQDLHERVPEQDALPRIPIQVSTFEKSIFVHQQYKIIIIIITSITKRFIFYFLEINLCASIIQDHHHHHHHVYSHHHPILSSSSPSSSMSSNILCAGL